MTADPRPALTRLRRRMGRGEPGPVVRTAAAVGLASRAIVYGTLTVLVLQVALAHRRQETDQGSALARLGTSGVGRVLLVLLVVGVVCYAGWRWLDAWTGSADADDRSSRVQAVVEGLGYLPMGYLAISVLAGDPHRADQGRNYRSDSGRVLQHGWGQWLVGAVGLGVVVLGGFFVWQGVRRTFAENFDFPAHAPWVRRIVLGLGTVGSVGRGLIFAEAGVLVIYAAATVEPGKAGGLDSALETLAGEPFGPALLVVAAAGFAAFALFAVAEAIWRER